eukprot:g6972.t1
MKLLDFMKSRLSLVLDEQFRPHVMTVCLDSCKVNAGNKRSGARSGEISIDNNTRGDDDQKRVRKYQRATRFQVDGELANIILTVEIPEEDADRRVHRRGSSDLWITVYELNQGAAFTLFVTAAQHDILRAKIIGRNDDDEEDDGTTTTYYKDFCVSVIKATRQPTLRLSFTESAVSVLDEAGLRRG